MKIGFHLVCDVNKLWIWDKVQQGICWQIRDGWNNDFWWDIWLDGYEPLGSKCLLPSPPPRTPVACMLTPSGDWDWVRLSQVLPLDIVDRIASVLLPHAALGRDRPA
ncbi:hypothetical protein V6N11_018666 [Hibiscus sabdariffa]|uniref:Uncharacterized protein n=1 Tax=Hibiscus sabdariffa TaxID=183260 RepID=A0ABR2QSW7_9ROSI